MGDNVCLRHLQDALMKWHKISEELRVQYKDTIWMDKDQGIRKGAEVVAVYDKMKTANPNSPAVEQLGLVISKEYTPRILLEPGHGSCEYCETAMERADWWVSLTTIPESERRRGEITMTDVYGIPRSPEEKKAFNPREVWHQVYP
jgi:hypothetical protein